MVTEKLLVTYYWQIIIVLLYSTVLIGKLKRLTKKYKMKYIYKMKGHEVLVKIFIAPKI